jgi:hypothetical protein
LEKESSQGLDRGLVKRGEKAAERRTRLPRLEPLVKGFQRSFTACGIAEKHGDKIDHLITPEAATSKAHLLFHGSKHALAL